MSSNMDESIFWTLILLMLVRILKTRLCISSTDTLRIDLPNPRGTIVVMMKRESLSLAGMETAVFVRNSCALCTQPLKQFSKNTAVQVVCKSS